MTKRNKAVFPKQNSRVLIIRNEKGKSEVRKLAEVMLSPTVLNTLTVQSFVKSIDEIDLTEAVAIMDEKSDKIIDGDLSELESTLTAQVVSLNAIYNTLADRSVVNMGHYLKSSEVYMRLALKAQAQCARTVEVLVAMKNPPIVFAEQANIAQGHQQINNGNQSPTYVGKTKNPANELLSEDDHATLDTQGAVETGGTHQKLAAMETIHGS